MRQAIYNALSGDSTFMTPLTGGFYDGAVVGHISRWTTPDAFDTNKEIEPCGLLRMRGPVPLSPYDHGARLSFELYFYQFRAYTAIEVARERAYVLLHYQQLTPVGATAGCWEIHHTNDVLQQDDEGLPAKMEMSRFEAIIRRL